MKNPRVAVVADWLTSRGGAEHVVRSLAEAFPGAEIFTSVYDQDLFPEFETFVVHTSFLQKLPARIRNKHQFLLPFFPMAFRRFDLSDFDVIISSSSSGFSKCVRKTRPDQKHICYCHTPVRFLYHARDEYIHGYPLPWYLTPVKWILPFLLNWLTKVDLDAVLDVDQFVSNSDFVGKRIAKYYERTSTTIYPGVSTEKFVDAGKKSQKSDYFVAVGRFIPYKKFDLLVKTFVKNGLPLKLGGKGPELEKCISLAQNASNIEFLGFVDYDTLPSLYANARAFLFPAEEDFGLTPVEAMSAGTPVIYYDAGGATESVGRGEHCGVAFDAQTPESLQGALDQFEREEDSFQKDHLVARGVSFDQMELRRKMHMLVDQL